MGTLHLKTLEHIAARFDIDLSVAKPQPIDIPGMDRGDLAALFGELGFKEGAEVGVEQGLYSEVLCRRNPGLRLHCVDAWLHYSGYRDHVSQDKLDGFFELTKARLAPYDCHFHRAYSVEAAATFAPESLDFVYIDANHTYAHVVADINAWHPKVRKGGILSGHDFCRRNPGPYQVHVVEAVTGWTQAYHIAPWFVVGRKDTAPGERRDRPRSWMWVKS